MCLFEYFVPLAFANQTSCPASARRKAEEKPHIQGQANPTTMVTAAHDYAVLRELLETYEGYFSDLLAQTSPGKRVQGHVS